MPITSSISKTSIRPIVQLNNVRAREISKKPIYMVKKESFWDKKTVVTKPKTPYLKPEFKPHNESNSKTFSLKIFSNKQRLSNKKNSAKLNKIQPSEFYIDETVGNKKRKALKIVLITVGVVLICLALLTLLLFKDISLVAKSL
jgi:hypothetical protein